MLLTCTAFAAWHTVHWPLVGDASLMHYVAFLIDHGLKPYRDIADINMPGAWLTDYVVIHALGGGPLAWRVFDLLLAGVALASMTAIAGPASRLAGIAAGATFTLVHLQDGLYEAGQRDLVIAVLVLAAYAALFRATRNGSSAWMFTFGLTAGLAATIKPTFFLLGPILLLLLIVLSEKNVRRSLVPIGLLGWLTPLVGVALLLWRMRSLPAFITTTRSMLLYHSALARRPLGYLLLHSVSPLMPLLVLWVYILSRSLRRWLNWEGAALGVGLMTGLTSYIVQAKGYSYQRYPLIAILLLVIVIDYSRGVHGRGFYRAAGVLGFAYITLYIAPVSAMKVRSFDWRNQQFGTLLEHDLEALGGRALSQHIQCIDTIEGCYDALYNLRLVSSTGYLYDEFIFGNPNNRIIATTQSGFWRALQASPPRVIVVTDRLFPLGPDDYKKLQMWPLLKTFLSTNYEICAEGNPARPVRWWSRVEAPNSFRLYCLAHSSRKK